MKRIGLAALAGAVLGTGTVQLASAADIPAPVHNAPPVTQPAMVVASSWTGFYVGVNGGYGWGQNCWTAIPDGFDRCFDTKGPAVGGQVGFNWQTGSLVLGIEGSGNWADIKGEAPSFIFPNDINRGEITALFTATARAGLAWDRTLFYVKGGAAWVFQKHFGICSGTPACNPLGFVFADASETRAGWTVGGGVEIGFTRNVSFALEYSYADFGSDDVTLVPTAAGGCNPCARTINHNLSWVTGRINYRFGGPS